jgi:polysaccharide export outer membrane protein
MNKIIYGTIFLAFSILMSSCINTNKLYYFSDQLPSIQQYDSLKQFAIQRIQPMDRIAITIGSTDPALTAYLNPFNTASGQNASVQQNSNSNGYLVNAEGNIEFPLLGKVPVIGLTSVEAAKLIKDKLAYYYKDLFVNVNLNSKVYFLNGRQGTAISMNNERLTIFEALTQSGLQDAYDIKSKVWLIREDSGKRYFTQVNLNSKKVFESPYYYLHSNDLIYIQPNKYTISLAPTSPFRGIVAVLGSIAAIIIAIKSLN